jgi:hypothetical protein
MRPMLVIMIIEYMHVRNVLRIVIYTIVSIAGIHQTFSPVSDFVINNTASLINNTPKKTMN